MKGQKASDPTFVGMFRAQRVMPYPQLRPELLKQIPIELFQFLTLKHGILKTRNTQILPSKIDFQKISIQDDQRVLCLLYLPGFNTILALEGIQEIVDILGRARANAFALD